MEDFKESPTVETGHHEPMDDSVVTVRDEGSLQSSTPKSSCGFLQWLVVLWSITTFLLFYPEYMFHYPRAFLLHYGADKVAAYAFPLHLVASPIALFGGMIQVNLGVTKRRVLHKWMGRIVLLFMMLGLIGAYCLIALLPAHRGWHHTLNLIGLATYTTVCLVFGIYFIYVKKDPSQHQTFMIRTLGGWFNFVTYRWALMLSGGSFWAATASELAMLVAVEIVVGRSSQEEKQPETTYDPVIDLADIDT